MYYSYARVTSVLLAIALALPASSALSEKWRDWAKGPVVHLMTEDEKGEWARLSTDEDAARFEALFWAKRDPSPGTPINENRIIFDRRVAAADENFTSGRVRGALSDRGRVLILLGAPDRAKRSGTTQSTIQSGFAGAAESARGEAAPTDVWTYERDSIQPWMGRHEFEVAFIDEYGDGRYELQLSPRRNVAPILEAAVEQFLVSPDLQEVPVTIDRVVVTEERATELRSESIRAAWETFRAADDPGATDLHVTWGQFITPSGTVFVPVQLYVPEGSDLPREGDVTFFGVVENEGGEVVAVYEEPLSLIESKGDAFVDKSLMLEPGSYSSVFGLAVDGAPVAMKRTAMEIRGPAMDQASVSEIILSNNVYPLAEAQTPTDPYAFGGLKVVPKGDRSFSTNDDIWYVIAVRNPGLTDEGAPNLQIKLDVTGETNAGQPVRMSAPTMPASVSPVRDTEGHYVVGSSFPAGAFKPGSYLLKARLLDSVTKKSWNLEAPFTVHE